jgi:hypothetical protein
MSRDANEHLEDESEENTDPMDNLGHTFASAPVDPANSLDYALSRMEPVEDDPLTPNSNPTGIGYISDPQCVSPDTAQVVAVEDPAQDMERSEDTLLSPAQGVGVENISSVNNITNATNLSVRGSLPINDLTDDMPDIVANNQVEMVGETVSHQCERSAEPLSRESHLGDAEGAPPATREANVARGPLQQPQLQTAEEAEPEPHVFY